MRRFARSRQFGLWENCETLSVGSEVIVRITCLAENPARGPEPRPARSKRAALGGVLSNHDLVCSRKKKVLALAATRGVPHRRPSRLAISRLDSKQSPEEGEHRLHPSP